MPCQAKHKSAVEVKVQQHATPAWRVKMCYEYLIRWRNRFKPGELVLSRMRKSLILFVALKQCFVGRMGMTRCFQKLEMHCSTLRPFQLVFLFLVRGFPGIDVGGRGLSNLETNYFDTKHYSSLTQYTTAKWDTSTKRNNKLYWSLQIWQTTLLFCSIILVRQADCDQFTTHPESNILRMRRGRVAEIA